MKIIRSTKVSLKETNPEKIQLLNLTLLEYGRIVNLFIDRFWISKQLPKKNQLLKPIIDSVLPTWLSARLRKVAAREALDMVLGEIRSVEETGNKLVKPTHNCRSMHVSSTIARLETKKNSKLFDCWLHISSVGFEPLTGQSVILNFPIKLHKHFHKLNQISGSVRCNDYVITNGYVQLSFKIDTGEKLKSDRCIGVDTGIKTLAAVSTGHRFGTDIEQTINKIKICKHGSNHQKSLRRSLKQRMDEVCIELFDTISPTLIVVENLKGLSHKTKVKHRLTRNMRCSVSTWVYRYWLDRLQRECEARRSRFRSVNPWKTSQRCSSCGFTDRRNRDGQVFLCRSCNHTENADTNASRNILDRFLIGPYGAGCKPLSESSVS